MAFSVFYVANLQWRINCHSPVHILPIFFQNLDSLQIKFTISSLPNNVDHHWSNWHGSHLDIPAAHVNAWICLLAFVLWVICLHVFSGKEPIDIGCSTLCLNISLALPSPCLSVGAPPLSLCPRICFLFIFVLFLLDILYITIFYIVSSKMADIFTRDSLSVCVCCCCCYCCWGWGMVAACLRGLTGLCAIVRIFFSFQSTPYSYFQILTCFHH